MNRLELPAPPVPPPFFPLPPPPFTATPPNPGGRRGRQAAATLALGLALILLSAVVSVVASAPSRGDQRPLIGSEGSHSFIGLSAVGAPYRWDPCSPIRYQVDLGGMDDRVVADVEEAVRRTSEASGLRFVFDGLVRVDIQDLVSSGNFVTESPGGLRWSPVLVAFRSRAAMRELDVRRAYGITYPVTSRFDADQFVSGLVVINASAHLEAGFDRAPSVGTVVQHELGHAVGLGHILDPFQLMSPMPIVRDWGKGDRAGLEQLGAGPCLEVPTAELHAAVMPLA